MRRRPPLIPARPNNTSLDVSNPAVSAPSIPRFQDDFFLAKQKPATAMVARPQITGTEVLFRPVEVNTGNDFEISAFDASPAQIAEFHNFIESICRRDFNLILIPPYVISGQRHE